MAMRNFWLAAKVDGRATRVSGGPQGKHGGMSGTLYVRDNGESVPAFFFHCEVTPDGRLRVTVDVDGTDLIVRSWER